jgi:hypothetical protein
MLTQQYLHQVFDYIDGHFYRKIKTSNFANLGKVGHIGNRGYEIISVCGRQYLAHRLAWFYVYGVMPSMIDHIDGDRKNNKIENLRICDCSKNAMNSGVKKRNKLGVKGVFESKNGKYVAQICLNYKKIHIGTFHTIEEASDAYAVASKLYHKEFSKIDELVTIHE